MRVLGKSFSWRSCTVCTYGRDRPLYRGTFASKPKELLFRLSRSLSRISFFPPRTTREEELSRMAPVLLELEEVLLSKQKEIKMTLAEEQLIHKYKMKAIWDSFVVATASAAVTCAATRRFAWGHRLNISIGSFLLGARWKFNKSIDACADAILGMRGSRVQSELAAIILTKHAQDTSMMKLLRKHFYTEEVYHDFNPDKHFLAWYTRYYYSDGSDTKEVEQNQYSTNKKVDMQPSCYSISPGEEMFTDPLYCIFGHPENSNEDAIEAGVPSKRRPHTRRKHNRRLRDHHLEHSDGH